MKALSLALKEAEEAALQRGMVCLKLLITRLCERDANDMSSNWETWCWNMCFCLTMIKCLHWYVGPNHRRSSPLTERRNGSSVNITQLVSWRLLFPQRLQMLVWAKSPSSTSFNPMMTHWRLKAWWWRVSTFLSKHLAAIWPLQEMLLGLMKVKDVEIPNWDVWQTQNKGDGVGKLSWEVTWSAWCWKDT